MKKSNVLILIAAVAVLSVNIFGSRWSVKDQIASTEQITSIAESKPVIHIEDQNLMPSQVHVEKGDPASVLQVYDSAYSLSVIEIMDEKGLAFVSRDFNPAFWEQREWVKDKWEVSVKGLRQVYLNDRLIWSADSLDCKTVTAAGHE